MSVSIISLTLTPVYTIFIPIGYKSNVASRQSSDSRMGRENQDRHETVNAWNLQSFKQKYGVKLPCVSDQYFDIRKDFL